jgi:hypothetical protein
MQSHILIQGQVRTQRSILATACWVALGLVLALVSPARVAASGFVSMQIPDLG